MSQYDLSQEIERLKKENSKLTELVRLSHILDLVSLRCLSEGCLAASRLLTTISAGQVTAKGLADGQKLLMCGYLNKYSERPGSWLAGLLNKEWNLRFFCLYGNTLQYFKTEQDMLGHPRGHIDLQVSHEQP